MKIIMGIDPGSYITGYGIIFQNKNKISYIDSGCIHTEIKDFFCRLKQIYVDINKIITKFKPNCLAIEQVFVGKNFNSALKLGHTRGVAIIAALNQALPIFEYASRQVKKTVVGIGSAKKKQVQYMVCSLLKLYSKPQLDASDALAIAITHSYMSNNRISDIYL